MISYNKKLMDTLNKTYKNTINIVYGDEIQKIDEINNEAKRLKDIRETILSIMKIERTKEIEISVDPWTLELLSRQETFLSNGDSYSILVASRRVKIFVDYDLDKFQIRSNNWHGIAYPAPSTEVNSSCDIDLIHSKRTNKPISLKDLGMVGKSYHIFGENRQWAISIDDNCLRFHPDFNRRSDLTTNHIWKEAFDEIQKLGGFEATKQKIINNPDAVISE